MTRARRTIFGLACLCVLGLAAFLGSGAPTVGAAESFPGQGFLPDNRAWEMVSPPEKHGGGVLTTSWRTRAAADGSAASFISRVAFGDTVGTGVAAEYLAERSTSPDPGDSGWSTHAITPPHTPYGAGFILSELEPRYLGDFSPDLDRGVFFSSDALTADPGVATANLYARDDLRTPGAGSFRLLTPAEPGGETITAPPTASEEPFLPLVIGQTNPQFSGSSPDLSHVIFSSVRNLTADAPAQSPFCGTQHYIGPPGVFFCATRLYEFDNGVLHLAGRVPAEPATEISCDDAGGPTEGCEGAAESFAGQRGRAPEGSPTPRTISDGSDGHTRVFFTLPTGGEETAGRLYMRIDHTVSVELNASERTTPDSYAPAKFLYASSDGTRAFFTSAEALTDDALVANGQKLYMYDASKPASDPHNLTFMDPGVGGSATEVKGLIGASDDGRYVYFAAAGDLIAGKPTSSGIYLWHDGALSLVGQAPNLSPLADDRVTGISARLSPRQSRVSSDGRHLLFSTIDGTGLLSAHGGEDYDQGACESGVGTGCRELYLYSADTDSLRCASCNPSGAPATVYAYSAFELSGEEEGSTSGVIKDPRDSHALSDDGRYVFFSSAEKLVPEDVNGVSDAYEYDSQTGQVHLLSSGQDRYGSFFLDASADGSDAFFATRERLSGWDVDRDYDLYDARVNGGFPEPLPPPPACQGDACQPAPAELNDSTPSSSSFVGRGDARLHRSCAAVGKRAARLSRRAKRLRRLAGKTARHSPRRAKRIRHRAHRLGHRAHTLSRGARRCRQAERRVAK